MKEKNENKLRGSIQHPTLYKHVFVQFDQYSKLHHEYHQHVQEYTFHVQYPVFAVFCFEDVAEGTTAQNAMVFKSIVEGDGVGFTTAVQVDQDFVISEFPKV